MVNLWEYESFSPILPPTGDGIALLASTMLHHFLNRYGIAELHIVRMTQQDHALLHSIDIIYKVPEDRHVDDIHDDWTHYLEDWIENNAK